MDYEEQLSAAKFRAERDIARQEVKELREELDAIKAEREYDVKALNHRIAEMGPRLMPECCEWPRYEDGEPVLIGDDVIGPNYGEHIHVDEITFHANGFTLREKTGLDNWYESDDRFKHPAVLAADGEPLEVGQTVWGVEDGKEFKVVRPLCGDGLTLLKYRTESGGYVYTATEPEHLTHQSPAVPAGDGMPIKAGDTIYSDDYKEGLIVDGYQHDGSLIAHMRDGNHVVIRNPQHFTHTKPEQDSWEKWRDEFIKPPCVYCRDILGVEFDDDTELDRAFDAQVQDMERRAMKLAEKENGNE